MKGWLEEAYEAGFYGPLDLKEAKVKELLEEAKKVAGKLEPKTKPKEIQMLLKLKDAIWGEADSTDGGYWAAMEAEDYDEECDEYEEYGDEDSVV